MDMETQAGVEMVVAIPLFLFGGTTFLLSRAMEAAGLPGHDYKGAQVLGLGGAIVGGALFVKACADYYS